MPREPKEPHAELVAGENAARGYTSKCGCAGYFAARSSRSRTCTARSGRTGGPAGTPDYNPPDAIMPDHEAELGLTSCPKHCFGRALAKSDAVVVGEVAEMDEATIIGD